MPTITTETTLHVCTCCLCGISFAFPDYFQTKRREDGANFFCPNGHSQHYTKSVQQELEEARRLLTEAKCVTAAARAELQREREDRAKEVMKTKRRHASGKCPCCSRTFASLARHIKHKHPEYLPQKRSLP